MKHLTLVLGLTLGLVNSAFAADPEAGKALTMVCSACHGADGNSAAGTFPKLAGQNEKYLLKQLNDIKSGARPVPTMAGQLDNLGDEGLANIAAFYASQVMSGGQAEEAKVEPTPEQMDEIHVCAAQVGVLPRQVQADLVFLKAGKAVRLKELAGQAAELQPSRNCSFGWWEIVYYGARFLPIMRGILR